MQTEYLAVTFTILFTIATSVPLGLYMFRVFKGERTFLDPVFEPIERLVLRLTGVNPDENQDWKQYCRSLLISNVFMWVATFTVIMLQRWLPLNPDGIGDVEPTLAFNTISSFTTNTNLQHYSGETRPILSLADDRDHFSAIRDGGDRYRGLYRDHPGPCRQVPEASRQLLRRSDACHRPPVLPLALLVGVVLMWQGTPMTFEGAVHAKTLEGAEQTIARGVVAPEVAIKQLGTNGGGYFGPNSAHPYENPTPISNLAETWSILVIPMAMVWTLGYYVGRRRLAVVIFAVMLSVYMPMVIFAVHQEAGGNPAITAMGVDQSTGSMEGKEVRFGAGLSALWGVSTTVTSNGSVNSMHDSWTAAGWTHADDWHVAKQHFWRCRRRVHQYADLHRCGGLRGRNDDRAHAGVFGEESGGERDEARQPGTALASAFYSRRNRDCVLHLGHHLQSRNGTWMATQPRSTRILGDAVRVQFGDRQQRVGFRRPRRQYTLLEHFDRVWRCCWGGTSRSSLPWLSRARWPPNRLRPKPPVHCGPTAAFLDSRSGPWS